MLAQCPALAHLNPSDNKIGNAGAESLAGVLGQFRALAHLNLAVSCLTSPNCKHDTKREHSISEHARSYVCERERERERERQTEEEKVRECV